MGFHTPDFVRVTIDGSDRTDYVIAYQRQSSICSFSDTFGLELNFDIPVDPEPYDAIVIRELYDGGNEKVLSGYIIDVTQTGNPGSFIINGQDKTLLLDDYFIPAQHTANGESAVYWISWYANQVGLDVQYDANYVSVFVVEPGTPMGMMTCSQGLAMLERLAAVYIKYDANIDKLRVFRINTSEPIIHITNDATTRFQRELSTEKTRNKVNVYGGYTFNIFTGETRQVIATATTVLDELIVDKTVVMANPLIRRQTIANLVASRILGLVDSVDDVVNLEVAGFYPGIDVGEFASIDVGRGDFTYAADREITSIQTSVDAKGAITIFTVGEKCPRVSIMPPLSVVYATAINGGVLVSWDGGESFGPFNRGLPGAVGEVASGLNGYSIAANKYGQLMSIVGSGVYRRTGKYGSWTEVSLPNPSNDEAEAYFGITDLGLQKVEKESGYFGRFHVLTNATASGGIVPSGQERWWNYWTQSYGNSWDSMQLYAPGSGVASGVGASGLPIELYNGAGITHDQLLEYATISGLVTWNVVAKDIEGAVSGNVTILVQGEPDAYIPEDTTTAETFYTTGVAYTTAYKWWCHTWWMDGSSPYQGNDRSNWIIGTEILSDGNAMYPIGARTGNNAVFSIPNNREMAYAIVERTGVGGGVSVARTNGYRPAYGWQDVPQWEKVASAYFDEQPETDFFGLEAYSVLLDYSSLQPGSDKVNFCIIGACLEAGGGGDNYPGSCHIFVNCYFFEDDISIPASGTSCTVVNDNRIIGIKDYPGDPITYYGEGTYGWENQDGETASPTPRGWHQIEPMPQGGQPSAITQNLTGGGNTGYWAIIVHDTGYYHGDDRDAGWPGEQHPRDWGEKGSIGIYTVKVDFDAKEITGIGLWQEFAPDFHDPGPDPEQPLRDIDIEDWNSGQSMTCTFIQPDLIFFTENWEAQGGLYGHYLTYPGLSHSKNEDWDDFAAQGNHQYSTPINQWEGVRKTAFYSGTTIGYAAYGRELDGGEYVGPVDSRMLYRNHSEATVDEPPVAPSGMLKYYKGHPDFGYCATERRATANYPLTNDFIFMWKAQRATPNVFEVMGNSSRYTDPYAQTAYGVPYSLEWDFRTASGSTPHPSGGAFFNWNWLDG